MDGSAPAEPAVVWLIENDLIFESRIQAQADAVGTAVKIFPALAEALDGCEALPARLLVNLTLIDPLGLPRLAAWRAGLAAPPTIIAYGPHVEADLLRAARQAGCDTVVPRSEFVKRLGEFLTVSR